MSKKQVFKTIIIALLGVSVLGAAGFGLGVLDLKMSKFFGVRRANIKREIFKENKSHVEGMISDLAKFKYEYETEENDIAKQAIENLIRDRFANFDLDNIDNYGLKQFLVSIRGY